MYIRKEDMELRAVEEQEFPLFRSLLVSSSCAGDMSTRLCREGVRDMETLVAVSGSGNLPSGRLMTVWKVGKRTPLGFFIIESMDWKNGVMEIGVLPGEGTVSEMGAALKILAEFGFEEMGTESVVVRCVADDETIGEICQEAGFSLAVVLRSRIVREGVRKDVAIHTQIKGEGKE